MLSVIMLVVIMLGVIMLGVIMLGVIMLSVSILFFRIANNLIRVPMLVPGLEYTFETLVECVSDLGISDQIRVFVIGNKVSNFFIRRESVRTIS